ncbi:MAG TPA: aspartate--tRNA ligase, partial [Pyrinomonadaceae bacterium]|nr:aspartate--tRNA ligase [Pyrinomonadaceae bacterium]
TDPQSHATAGKLRTEFCIAVRGLVVPRPEGLVNPKMQTGAIEIEVREVDILSASETPVFELADEIDTNEETRLQYRFLDLRRRPMQQALLLRHRIAKTIRDYFDEQGFVEIETPFLTKSTPEGARDYLVPSRINPGWFYALPQSPQLFKQLLMMSGFDRYVQIVRCFRDEDLRADRQPEFTQLDVEMSFANQEMVFRVIEGMFNSVLCLIGVELPAQWPRMTYAEAMRRYGSDKPDLRFEMELQDLTANLAGTDFAPFASVIEAGGEIKAITVKGKADYSRKQLDELQEFAKRYGAGALAWIKIGEAETTSSLLKVLGEEKIGELANAAGAEKGDAVLIIAGRKPVVAASLGALRIEVAKRENLIDRTAYKPLLVTEFPMFELDEESGHYMAAHHPFTSPMDEDLEMFRIAIEDESQHHLLGNVRAKAYDAVINGYECAGGSIRIHQKEIQALNFKALGLTPETARERFGFFLDALEFGTPPHGGFAAGIERTCMILCGTENIRDVMAFPKTASAQDLMMDSPGNVDPHQLDELGIKVV